MDSQVQSAIASYETAKIAFDKATAETQASLEACGWQWVAKDIAEYSSNPRYQDWLVSPEMYESLDLNPLWGGSMEMQSEPDSKWIENADYILF